MYNIYIECLVKYLYTVQRHTHFNLTNLREKKTKNIIRINK